MRGHAIPRSHLFERIGAGFAYAILWGAALAWVIVLFAWSMSAYNFQRP